MGATGEADWVLFVAPGIWSIVAIILRFPLIALATITEAAARHLEESRKKIREALFVKYKLTIWIYPNK